MIKVYQTLFNSGIDPNPGNCWQAVYASLLELPLQDVPHFMSFGDDCFKVENEFLKSKGYRFDRQISNPRRLRHMGDDLFPIIKRLNGFDGYFKACVYSPKYFTPDAICSPSALEPTHVLVIDRDFNIVHDPNPDYQSITQYPLSHFIGYNGIISFDVISKI